YWPSGFEFPWPQGIKTFLQAGSRNRAVNLVRGIVSLRWIPNVGRMRFIYGGTSKQRTDDGESRVGDAAHDPKS
ncbi:MAG: hypothetical protein JW741_19855, partial [Sedimentisphaerales bacterium]|nr:hypothetical protein [Sedimentisphaerales bacterium]